MMGCKCASLTIALVLLRSSYTSSFTSSSYPKIRTCQTKTKTHRNPVFADPIRTKEIVAKTKSINRQGAIALRSAVEKSEARPSSTQKFPLLQDVSTVLRHAAFCLLTAAVVSFYEGYDCAYLKPQTATIRNFPVTLQQNHAFRYSSTDADNDSQIQTHNVIDIMNTATRGMGRGRIDRLDGWYQNTYFGYDANEQVHTYTTNKATNKFKTFLHPKHLVNTNNNNNNNAITAQNIMRQIPSYNEIMEEHRLHTIPAWRRHNPSPINTNSIQSRQLEVEKAVGSVYRALQMIDKIKLEANDYNWDNMKKLLDTPTLRIDLLDGCSALRGAVGILDNDARTEIGFDWGSCAWRHCGANADAQEALAELYNNAGMLEPFECLFTIDIVERSLRDILAVVPSSYHPVALRTSLHEYVPYQRQTDTDGYANDEEGSIDTKFVNTLAGLRNDYSN